jgi:(2R)-sulfolactate sulfo-lyase subunit alpha
MRHKYLVHGEKDNVGVVVQDIKKGETVIGIFLDSNTETTITSNNDISLGHKIALTSIQCGDFAIEYGETIGKATQDIHPGDWTHIHNLKSARW